MELKFPNIMQLYAISYGENPTRTHCKLQNTFRDYIKNIGDEDPSGQLSTSPTDLNKAVRIVQISEHQKNIDKNVSEKLTEHQLIS